MARRPRPQEGAARCRSRATWASGQAGHPERRCLLVGGEAQRSWRRRLWGGWSSQASTRPRALSTGSGSREPRRPAGGGLGTDSASRPSSPPAGAEVVPAGTADRGEALGGVSAVTVPTAGAVRESATMGITGEPPARRP